MYYFEKTCSGCGNLMHEGEDIVVCPECGTPQHRECYLAGNRCVNEHLHAEGFDWRKANEPAPVPESVQTTVQTEEKKENDTPDFTGANSEPFPNIPLPTFQMDGIYIDGKMLDINDCADGVSVKEMVNYTQINSNHYIKNFFKNKGKKFFLSWNWGAFFCGPIWFFYRKLYKAGAVSFALLTALSIVLSPYITPVFNRIWDAISTGVAVPMEDKIEFGRYYAPTLVVTVIFTLIANYLYRAKMLDDIKFAKKATSDPKVLNYSLIRRGGVSLLAGIVAFFATYYLPGIIMDIVSYFLN